MVDVVGEKHQQRRLMVVTLFISTLVKAVCKLRLPNSNSGEKSNRLVSNCQHLSILISTNKCFTFALIDYFRLLTILLYDFWRTYYHAAEAA
jgi:hypothetical protein